MFGATGTRRTARYAGSEHVVQRAARSVSIAYQSENVNDASGQYHAAVAWRASLWGAQTSPARQNAIHADAARATAAFRAAPPSTTTTSRGRTVWRATLASASSSRAEPGGEVTRTLTSSSGPERSGAQVIVTTVPGRAGLEHPTADSPPGTFATAARTDRSRSIGR